MNSNKKMDAMFRQVVHELEKAYGNGMQTNFSLIEIANQVCPEIGIGQNVIRNMDYDFKKMRGKHAIINSDNREGIHWVASYQRGKTIYIFDSFGRPTKTLLPEFYKRAVDAGFKIIDTEYDAEQLDHQQDCGIRCLAWIIICKHQGIRNALKI